MSRNSNQSISLDVGEPPSDLDRARALHDFADPHAQPFMPTRQEWERALKAGQLLQVRLALIEHVVDEAIGIGGDEGDAEYLYEHLVGMGLVWRGEG